MHGWVVNIYVMLYCCTAVLLHIVVQSVVGRMVLLYSCCTVVHTWVRGVVGGWVIGTCVGGSVSGIYRPCQGVDGWGGPSGLVVGGCIAIIPAPLTYQPIY